MPKTTQYIRDEDIEAWKALENKSQWIHEHLNHATPGLTKKIENPIKVVTAMAAGARAIDALDAKKYCEHGQLKGQCLVKGCKYAKA